MRLKLIVHLVRRETMEREYERLPYEPLTQDVLGVPVRKAVIQVVAGPQHRRAGRSRGAQHHPAAARRGHLPGVRRAPPRAMEQDK
jgi:hypothetical protein